MNARRILVIGMTSALISACSSDDSEANMPTAPIAMTALQVDHLTLTFEGGVHFRQMSVPNAADSLPIRLHYQSPGDFGSVALAWVPTGDTLFFGDVIWLGLGERHMPASLLPTGQFRRINAIQPFPDPTDLQWLHPVDTAAWGMRITQAWKAIDDFELVHQRHPELPIGVLFYTPSVGMGDPATWKYWFFIPRGAITPGA